MATIIHGLRRRAATRIAQRCHCRGSDHAALRSQAACNTPGGRDVNRPVELFQCHRTPKGGFPANPVTRGQFRSTAPPQRSSTQPSDTNNSSRSVRTARRTTSRELQSACDRGHKEILHRVATRGSAGEPGHAVSRRRWTDDDQLSGSACRVLLLAAQPGYVGVRLRVRWRLGTGFDHARLDQRRDQYGRRATAVGSYAGSELAGVVQQWLVGRGSLPAAPRSKQTPINSRSDALERRAETTSLLTPVGYGVGSLPAAPKIFDLPNTIADKLTRGQTPACRSGS